MKTKEGKVTAAVKYGIIMKVLGTKALILPIYHVYFLLEEKFFFQKKFGTKFYT